MVRLAKPSAQTTARMRSVRQRATKPEVTVRGILSRLGHRYRTCVRTLPGSPDIANRSKKWAVFVHGCFWHGHAGCRFATVPKSNRTWWIEKLAANRARDARKRRALFRSGFRVITIWECSLSNPALIERRLERLLVQP